MTKTISFIFTVIAVVMFFDSLSFMSWKMSGQKPVDSMYAGAITANILASVNK